MNSYRHELINCLKERLENFTAANSTAEAEIVASRINTLTVSESAPQTEKHTGSPLVEENLNTIKKQMRESLKSDYLNLTSFEIDEFNEEIENAESLSALSDLRLEIIRNILKIHKTARFKKSFPQTAAANFSASGPYNNSKTFTNAVSLIENQDPLWLEGLKETYSLNLLADANKQA